MGVKSPSSLTYTVKNLSIKHVKQVIKDVRNESGEQTAAEEDEATKILKNRVDADINWLYYKLGANKRKSDAARIISEFLETLALYGFIVTPICDGEARHHSKRATTERIAKKERNKIQASIARLQLIAVSSQLRSDTTLSEEERNGLSARQKDLNEKVRKFESSAASEGNISPTFYHDLAEELAIRNLHETNDLMGRVEKVKVGQFQADPLIAMRAIRKESDIIISADTDFLVSVGRDCILMKSFYFRRGRGRMSSNTALMELQQIQLCCSNLQMRNSIERAITTTHEIDDINHQQDNNIIFVDPKYPVFDEETIRLRALIAVIIGSDVYIGGAPTIGVKMIFDKMKELREIYDDDDHEIIQNMLKWVVTKKKNLRLTEEMLNVFVDTMIFEPANEVGSNGETIFETDNKSYSYTHMRPRNLPRYLKDFCSEHDELCNIVDGPDLITCIGPKKDKEHVIMRGEDGVEKCNG